MEEKEKKEGEQEVKKDSLMWSEEDYDAMQRLTGFDEDSVEADQKKGINLIVFIIVCVVCLVGGILIGYNINKKAPEEKPDITVIKTVDDKKVETVAVYNRLNASGELYLYVLNSEAEEISILDLTNQKYAYQYIDEDLYVLLEKDGLNLYDYSFSKDGYHRELVHKFESEYNAFYFRNSLILIKNKNELKFYNIEGTLVSSVTLDADQIYDYTSEYIVYAKNNKINIYYIKTNNIKSLTKKASSFLYLDNDQVFYIEKNKLYRYSIIGDVLKDIATVKVNTIFTKIESYYMFNDGKTLYYFDKDVKKVKDFDYNINEIANLDRDNLVFILDDYNTTTCLMDDKKFDVYNISSKGISEKNISGCLNTQVINGLINIK